MRGSVTRLRRLSMRLLPRRSGRMSGLLIDHADEALGIATRRGVEPAGSAGRHHAERRGLDQRLIRLGDAGGLLDPGRRIDLFRKQRLKLGQIGDGVLAVGRHDSPPAPPIYHAASNCRPSWPATATSRMTPGSTGGVEPHRRELRRARDAAALGQHAAARADFAIEMAAQRRLALLAQAAGAVLDDVARDLRHPRRRRAGPRRERKDVKLRQPAFVDQIERAGKHLLGLGRKARDDVAAERHIGPQPPHLIAERNRVGAQMPALHALEDHVVAGLQRQMQMRHQPRRRWRARRADRRRPPPN